jgi:hypothetical protein
MSGIKRINIHKDVFFGIDNAHPFFFHVPHVGQFKNKKLIMCVSYQYSKLRVNLIINKYWYLALFSLYS